MTHVFGQYLEKHRILNKMSARHLASCLGVSHVYLRKVEKGESAPLHEDRWSSLIANLDTVTRSDLKKMASLSRPYTLDLTLLKADERSLALDFLGKLEEGVVSEFQIRAIKNILNKEKV
jgi:transcriptional regulator with XRE-family HTH domain